jgi:hypothetical protein
LAGHAPDDLLDTYEIERLAFARRLVQTTDRVFTFATAEGRLADLIRTRIAPVVIPALAKFDALREWMFRTVSQVTITYRQSPLSEGKAGDLRGGDRLPWIRVEGVDNYASLGEPKWQLHIYGDAQPELSSWCKEIDLALHVFPWRPQYAEVGLIQDALYLLRPDTYLTLVAADGSVDAVQGYFTSRRIQL